MSCRCHQLVGVQSLWHILTPHLEFSTNEHASRLPLRKHGVSIVMIRVFGREMSMWETCVRIKIGSNSDVGEA